jgi:hypothetical protein
VLFQDARNRSGFVDADFPVPTATSIASNTLAISPSPSPVGMSKFNVRIFGKANCNATFAAVISPDFASLTTVRAMPGAFLANSAIAPDADFRLVLGCFPALSLVNGTPRLVTSATAVGFSSAKSFI